MLNPTGMIETDLLLLDLMAVAQNMATKNEDYNSPEHLAAWRYEIGRASCRERV